MPEAPSKERSLGKIGNVGHRRAFSDVLVTWRQPVIQSVASWKETTHGEALAINMYCAYGFLKANALDFSNGTSGVAHDYRVCVYCKI